MTLSEIAQFSGDKIGKTDADTLTFLQKAASLNYRRVWNFAPWRETVTSSTYSVGTSRTITLGTTVESTLSISYDENELEPIDYQTIVSQDPGLLNDARTGTPQSYYFKGRNSSGVAEIEIYPRLATAGTTLLYTVEKLQCLTRSNYLLDFPPTTNALNDELRLPHVHHVVLALTTADALERERQYGKAQVVTQDANADLAAMANFELSQVGGIKQITPSPLGEMLLADITS